MPTAQKRMGFSVVLWVLQFKRRAAVVMVRVVKADLLMVAKVALPVVALTVVVMTVLLRALSPAVYLTLLQQQRLWESAMMIYVMPWVPRPQILRQRRPY